MDGWRRRRLRCAGEEGRKEGRRVGAAWLGGARFPPPRVRLSQRGKRGAGTEPRPFPSTRCPGRGKKRRRGAKSSGGGLSLSPLAPPSPQPPQQLRRTRCERGGKMAPPAEGRGRFRHTAAAARRRLHLLCGGRAASQGEGWSRGGVGAGLPPRQPAAGSRSPVGFARRLRGDSGRHGCPPSPPPPPPQRRGVAGGWAIRGLRGRCGCEKAGRVWGGEAGCPAAEGRCGGGYTGVWAPCGWWRGLISAATALWRCLETVQRFPPPAA